MSPQEERLREIVEPTLEGMGFELVRLRVMGGQGGRRTLQIMAERPEGGISIDQCAEISRTLSPLLDVADPFNGEYVLEVSSPGIARPLVRPKDFERFAGHEAKIELKEMIEGRKRFRGALDGFEDGHVMLALHDDKNEDGEEMVVGLPFDRIAEARLVLTDALLAAAQAAQSAEEAVIAAEAEKENTLNNQEKTHG